MKPWVGVHGLRAGERTKRRGSVTLSGALAVLVTVTLACSGDEGPTDSTPDEPMAVISGPDQVVLGCLGGTVGRFNAHQSTSPTPIRGHRWEVDGAVVGIEESLDYTFQEARGFSLTLRILDDAGVQLAEATKAVSAVPPRSDGLRESIPDRREGGRPAPHGPDVRDR